MFYQGVMGRISVSNASFYLQQLVGVLSEQNYIT